MKNIFLSGIVISLSFLFSCKKTENEEQQGVKFNLLLKTVKKSNTTGNSSITAYSYNTNGEIAEIKTADNYSTAATVTTQTFYRNISGSLDSIMYLIKSNGTISFLEKNYFKYDINGKLILSISNSDNYSNPPVKDSSLYNYRGTVLQKRVDFRSFDGGLSYILLRQAMYEFDASGNLSTSIFQWTTHPSIDTLIFKYDNMLNPVPAGILLFFWAPIFYNDYKPANNLTQTLAKNVDSYTYFDYRYAANNKPLYRKEKVTNGTGYTETFYYYD
jgi:hypothetical protein